MQYTREGVSCAVNSRNFVQNVVLLVDLTPCGTLHLWFWARVQRNWDTFPRYLVHRIGVNMHYLNWSVFSHSHGLLSSLWLIILELGLPLTCAGKGKLMTKKGKRYNKNQQFIQILVLKCIN